MKKSIKILPSIPFSQFGESLDIAYKSYLKQVKDNRQLKLIDIFCGFLVLIGIVQFLFIGLIRDTFPFNGFLAGFSSCVGQFVLLISLRLQLLESYSPSSIGISKQRSFGEFIFSSLILHFICLHFIN